MTLVPLFSPPVQRPGKGSPLGYRAGLPPRLHSMEHAIVTQQISHTNNTSPKSPSNLEQLHHCHQQQAHKCGKASVTTSAGRAKDSFSTLFSGNPAEPHCQAVSGSQSEAVLCEFSSDPEWYLTLLLWVFLNMVLGSADMGKAVELWFPGSSQLLLLCQMGCGEVGLKERRVERVNFSQVWFPTAASFLWGKFCHL